MIQNFIVKLKRNSQIALVVVNILFNRNAIKILLHGQFKEKTLSLNQLLSKNSNCLMNHLIIRNCKFLCIIFQGI